MTNTLTGEILQSQNATDEEVNAAYENAEHCVSCGEVIPEGRQTCPKCFGMADKSI